MRLCIPQTDGQTDGQATYGVNVAAHPAGGDKSKLFPVIFAVSFWLTRSALNRSANQRLTHRRCNEERRPSWKSDKLPSKPWRQYGDASSGS